MNRTFDADENYQFVVDYCGDEGVKIGSFINKAIAERLRRLGIIK
jgi:hypothetical protein